MKTNKKRQLSHKPRNPEKTKEEILSVAIKEFSSHGYPGGRVDRIAKAASVNMRMIYHYFQSKENLYVAALERVYKDVRTVEQELDIEKLPPDEAIGTLVDFTFDHFANHPDLVNLVMGENLLKAEYLKSSQIVPFMTAQLRKSVSAVLERGVQDNIFRQGIDPTHLWLTIFALCWTHLANKYTMSWTLQMDLGDENWLADRKKHVKDVVMRYIM
jgi:AcrR family transcriptional regulator